MKSPAYAQTSPESIWYNSPTTAVGPHRLEKVSYKAWQRTFGRSVQRRAPGIFVRRLTRLAESAGGQVITIPTRPTKLSQTCQCGRVEKKPLSLHVHCCEQCGLQIQRDLYSAYLIRFVDPKTYLLHADQAQMAWPGWEPILRAAWQQAHSTHQPASGRDTCPSSVRRQGAAVRQSRSPATGVPAKAKSPDAVAGNPREPGSGGGDAGQNLLDSSGRVVQQAPYKEGSVSSRYSGARPATGVDSIGCNLRVGQCVDTYAQVTSALGGSRVAGKERRVESGGK